MTRGPRRSRRRPQQSRSRGPGTPSPGRAGRRLPWPAGSRVEGGLVNTENSSRSEKEETEAPKKGGPADAGDASAAGAVSPQMPSPTPALGDDGEPPAEREGLGWTGAAASPGLPAPPTGPDAGAPPTGPDAAAAAGNSSGPAMPVQPGASGPPELSLPVDARTIPVGRPVDDPLELERPGPTIPSVPDPGAPEEEGRPPIEDTAVRRRSLFTAAPASGPAEQVPAEPDPVPDRGRAPEGRIAGDSGWRTEPPQAPGAGRQAFTTRPRGGAGAAGPGGPVDRVGQDAPAARSSRSALKGRHAADDDVPLDGSTVVGHPKSRTAAHWAGILVSIVALPIAWFFLHDGASAATAAPAEPHVFTTSARGAVELGSGALALAVALWMARYTSAGSIVVGVVSILLGLPFLVLPGVMTDVVSPFLDDLNAQSALGTSLSDYLWADAVTGKFLALGVFMVMVGVVSHSARRAGRREQEVIDRVRRSD